jgi:hypothetical protein
MCYGSSCANPYNITERETGTFQFTLNNYGWINPFQYMKAPKYKLPRRDYLKVPFDTILQEAIKKLWAENGKGEFVFIF